MIGFLLKLYLVAGVARIVFFRPTMGSKINAIRWLRKQPTWLIKRALGYRFYWSPETNQALYMDLRHWKEFVDDVMAEQWPR